MTLASTVLLAAATQLMAQSVTSESIGFNKVTCLNNSDTIVGVPFRSQGSRNSKLAAAPVVNGDVATLTLTATNLPLWPGHSRYVKFNSGTKEGRYYDITSNTDTTITLDLNGDTLGDATTGDALVIAEYWTLGTLFPPAVATTSPVTTGHAIVASTSTLFSGRRTEVLLPDVVSAGINLPVEGRYYIHGGLWKRSNSGNADYGGTRLYPDTLFTIGNPPSVTQATIFKSVGEVEVRSLLVPLTTRETTAQDNFIAIPRPLSTTLEQLNLRQSGAFMASTNTLTTGRRDQLLTFDNDLQLRNKAPSATYYLHGGIWKLHNGGNTDRGTDVIPAGTGFIIRKYPVVGQPTVFWNNTPSY